MSRNDSVSMNKARKAYLFFPVVLTVDTLKDRRESNISYNKNLLIDMSNRNFFL